MLVEYVIEAKSKKEFNIIRVHDGKPVSNRFSLSKAKEYVLARTEGGSITIGREHLNQS